MKRLVVVRVGCEIDPTLNVRVDRKSGTPLADPGDTLTRVAPAGRARVSAALALLDAHVVAVALGEGHEEALKHALAAGASEAFVLSHSGSEVVDPKALAAWLQERNASLYLGDVETGAVAHHLQWGHLAGLSDVRVDNGRLYGIRHLERGDREDVSSSLPAGLRLDPDAAKARYVSHARVAAVDASKIGRVELTSPAESPGAAGEIGPLQVARMRTKVGAPKNTSAKPLSANDRIKALMGLGPKIATTPNAPKKAPDAPESPAAMADELIRFLKHHDVLPSSLGNLR